MWRRVSLPFLCIPIILLLPACGDDDGPTAPNGPPSGTDLEIIFTGVAGGQPLLFRVPADGSATSTLIGGGIVGSHARPTPDGTALIFNVGTRTGELPAIMVWPLDQVSPFPLMDTQDPAGDGAVSPDGTRIAFFFGRDDGLGDVFVADWDPRGLIANPSNLTPPAPPAATVDRAPAWAPDGTRIAFVSNRSGLQKLWLMDADGGDQRQLLGDGSSETAPAWSPDGEWLAFELRRDGQAWTRIGLVRPDGTGASEFGLDGHCLAPAWSPDGRWLAIAVGAGAEYDIWIVDREGTVVRRLERPGLDADPAWLAR